MNFSSGDTHQVLTVVRPAICVWYRQGLRNFMLDQVAVAAMICFAGLLVWIGATMAPETKNVDLNDDANFTV
ncbi:hypothetical protein QO003_003082 [Arthrobacter silviterrae]|uniref:Uncharacterized protein n=1 Tax=Arthrobacter silviterrae TaxID=2026658 RepID=A0ABX0DAL3_9MICC|nr:hypothetical protein [Arthrobacter silviterrae]MDQ0278779.1 hypothetical protein [Arthrobacter silviterrae]NGN83952.1 hypothetical protein [Arthrobacter silviterrae]